MSGTLLKQLKTNPYIEANFVSRLFIWWLNPLFAKSKKKPLEASDLYNILPEHSSEKLGKTLRREWQKELNKKIGKPSLQKALFRCFGMNYLVLGILPCAVGVVQVCQAIILGELIQYFAIDAKMTTVEAYIYATALVLSAFLTVFCLHPYFLNAQLCGMQIRIACCSLLFRKALKLNAQSLSEVSAGYIINLMSNDVSRFDTVTSMLHFLWVGPLQSVIVLFLLWYVYELGPSTVVGFAYLFLLFPVMYYMSKMFSKFRSKTATLTDTRISLMSEILGAIQVIKMYTWERSFSKKILEIRLKEMRTISKSSSLKAVNSVIFFTSAKIIVFFTILAYIFTSTVPITTKQLFVFFGLSNLVRLMMAFFFVWGVQQGAESMSVIKRLQEFLLLEEVDSSALKGETSAKSKTSHVSNQDCFISAENITAVWNRKISSNPVLRNITFKVVQNQLMIVVGPVGAGKSSLLSVLLHELPVTDGTITIHGKVAYSSQKAWVFSGSIRQNIIFGQHYNARKYYDIINACALQKDFDLLPDGDKTWLGDSGANLSGGQKARINLARAAYFDADIYLLDDPLSAVDPGVVSHLFDKCINGYLAKKLRILVTHQKQFLEKADNILLLKEGNCISFGDFSNLHKTNIDIEKLLSTESDISANIIEIKYSIPTQKSFDQTRITPVSSLGY